MDITDITAGDAASYGGIAIFLPLIVAVINRPTFPAWGKQLIMVGVALVAGVITYGSRNDWDFTNTNGIITAVMGVVAVTQAAYRVLWSKGAAPAIEQGVNGGTSTEEPEPVDDDPEDDPEDDADLAELDDDGDPYGFDPEAVPEHAFPDAGEYDDPDPAATSPDTPPRAT